MPLRNSQLNVGSVLWTLYGAVSFVPTTIKSHGQNRYHVVEMPG